MTSFITHLFNLKQRSPRLPAIKIDDRIISYEELIDKAMLVATGLREVGARHETVGLVGQRKASSYIGLLGILFAGCSFTPINPKYNPTKISSILNASNIRFLVGDYGDITQLDSSSTGDIEACILPEGNATGHKGLIYVNEKSLSVFESLQWPVSFELYDLAYVNYTSGSTGKPKGVMISLGNLQSFLSNMKSIYQLEPGFRASQAFDLSFDPSVSDIFFTLTEQGTLCVLPEKEILVPSDFIVREEITFWNSVPSVASFMLKTGNLKPGAFPKLSHSMFCGEQFPTELAKAWRRSAPNSTIENLYGPTETTIYISRYSYSIEDEHKQFKNGVVPIGQAFYDHSVVLVDDENRKINDSRKGEIIFAGPQLAKGYLDDGDKTSQSFVKFDWDSADRFWYKTGDLGFFNIDGDLECVGRKDSQIKIAGRRIEIGDIESTLSKFKNTKTAVVVPLRDGADIVTGCVAFVLCEISKIEASEVRKKSGNFLDSVFFPKQFFTLDNFPLSQSGKTDRKSLEKLAQELME